MGQPFPRIEDRALLTGLGQYVDDLTLPGITHAAYLRSPHAHARIVRIDTAAAEALPGVCAVMTGEYVARNANPQRMRIKAAGSPNVYALAHDKVRYVGHPVAAVAAVDRATAEDALDLIEVEYETLPPLVVAADAMAPGAPLVFDEIGTNVLWHDTFVYGGVDEAFARADQIVRERIDIQRYSSTPLETFGSMAQYDPSNGAYTIWGHTQMPGQELGGISRALRVSAGQVRFIVPRMGGAFGNKLRPLNLISLALLARKAGRPVKFIEDRREALALSQSADMQVDVEAAITNDGEILALRIRGIVNEGAGLDFALRHNVLMLANTVNCYRVPAVSYEGYSVVSNRPPIVANRGIGKPVMCLAIERTVDAIAHTTGLDRAEVRFRNFIQPDQFPYETPSGNLYDSGDYPALLRKALEIIDYDGALEKQREGRSQGRLLGIGIAAGVEPGISNAGHNALIGESKITGAGEAARIRMEMDGTVTVYTGGLEAGQGHATALAQVVADQLGLHPDQVRVPLTFDSGTHPYVMTSGNYSNKFHGEDVAAAIGAAQKIRDRLLNRASSQLDAAAVDIELRDGRAVVRGVPDRSVAIAELAASAYGSLAPDQAEIDEPGLEVVHVHTDPMAIRMDANRRVKIQLSFPSAAHVALVEVDPDTYETKVLRYVIVHDCGREINPMIVDGQIHGSVVHGIAAALLEEFVYDAEGQLLSGSFMDYLKPTSADVPMIEGDRLATLSPFTPLGTKSVGEGAAVVAPAAIASAVENALEPLGIRIGALPITPSRLWTLASEGGARYGHADN
ncbi:MAG: Xanthine dehydrogenase family protein molybdopterin-binding subunit [Chloroflexi bacterium]|nr:Xanthine dehydrogenase family protein molybdopterin-binding subunit [Chloroflexota bacterium]